MSAVVRAVLVHLYTASGVLLALVAAMELCGPAPDPRRIFLALTAAVVIDATDGTLARRWEVKRVLPGINGRTIDDIVDYLTYTFLPLLLIWRMGWVPAPGAVWIAPAMVASLFGFANTGAKDEGEGFFLGFPSYWNVVAFYAVLRLGTLMEEYETLGAALFYIGLATLATATAGMLGAKHLARLVGYSVLVSTGILLASLGLRIEALTAPVLFYLIISALTTCTFFMLTGMTDRTRRANPPVSPDDGTDTTSVADLL